jgi:hypothetical protein
MQNLHNAGALTYRKQHMELECAGHHVNQSVCASVAGPGPCVVVQPASRSC